MKAPRWERKGRMAGPVGPGEQLWEARDKVDFPVMVCWLDYYFFFLST